MSLTCDSIKTAILMAVLASGIFACSASNSSGDGQGGVGNQDSGGQSAGGTANAQGGTPVAGSAGLSSGFVEPPSTITPTEQYTTSCEEQQCTSEELCIECPSGTCCGHVCQGQTGSTPDVVTYCDREGGII